MSTSFLYHALGMIGYHYLSTRYKKGKVFITAACSNRRIRCPDCGSRNVNLAGSKHRQFRTVPVGGKPVFVELKIPRVHCLNCGKVLQIRLGFADPRASYTYAFERYALSLLRSMTILDVSRHLGVGWDMIKDIQKRDLKRRYKHIPLKGIQFLAIDEISVKKGHKYKTLVMDLESGRVVYIADGKGADALDLFWKQLGRYKKNILAVSIDLGQAYTSAVKEHLPDSTLVFDHFHVVKLFNEKLSKYRRQLQNESDTKEGKESFKNTRWLLLKNPENLDPTKNQKERLDQVLEMNKGLSTAYILKESLRSLWSHKDGKSAKLALEDWIGKAIASGIEFLMKFAELLKLKMDGVLAYFKYKISSGKMEGNNNKIKTMKRQAYGYRDDEFFCLKILALHERKYA
jgi:transposase